MRAVAAREASRSFSRILKAPESVESVVITTARRAGRGHRALSCARTRHRACRGNNAKRPAARRQAFQPRRDARAVISRLLGGGSDLDGRASWDQFAWQK